MATKAEIKSVIQKTASAVRDKIQEVLADPSEEKGFSHRVSIFSTESGFVLSLAIQRNPIDPFRCLPWFAIEDILFQLADLPTLHQLYQASPAVADYLNNVPGIFPKVVERIIEHWCWNQGLDSDIQVQVRTLLYLWWSEETTIRGISSDGNPLTDSYVGVAMCFLHLAEDTLPNFRPLAGQHPLPRTTPPYLLYRLLAVMSSIRGNAHAFFHGCIQLCRAAQVERPRNRQKPWPKDQPRPLGINVENLVAQYSPPSWREEQRLIQAFLKPYLFRAFRRAVCDLRTLPLDFNSVDRSETWIKGTCHDLARKDMVSFWTMSWTGWERPVVELEQFEAILSWKEKGKPIYGAPNRHFQTCCHMPLCSARPHSRPQGLIRQSSVPGASWAQTCSVLTHSHVSTDGLQGRYRKFGVGFFDEYRMVDLGLMFPLPERENYITRRDLAFRWSTLLHPTDETVFSHIQDLAEPSPELPPDTR